MCNYHAEDLINRMFCTLEGGVKIPMPRYYKDKLYWDMERAAISAVYQIQAHDIKLKKMETQTALDVENEQKAIDASFDRMYLKALKTRI